MRFSPKGVFFIWLGIHKSIPPKSAPKKSYLPKIQGGASEAPPPLNHQRVKPQPVQNHLSQLVTQNYKIPHLQLSSFFNGFLRSCQTPY